MARSDLNVSKVTALIVFGGGFLIYMIDSRERRGYADEISKCISDIKKEQDRIRAIIASRREDNISEHEDFFSKHIAIQEERVSSLAEERERIILAIQQKQGKI